MSTVTSQCSLRGRGEGRLKSTRGLGTGDHSSARSQPGDKWPPVPGHVAGAHLVSTSCLPLHLHSSHRSHLTVTPQPAETTHGQPAAMPTSPTTTSTGQGCVWGWGVDSQARWRITLSPTLARAKPGERDVWQREGVGAVRDSWRVFFSKWVLRE